MKLLVTQPSYEVCFYFFVLTDIKLGITGWAIVSDITVCNIKLSLVLFVLLRILAFSQINTVNISLPWRQWSSKHHWYWCSGAHPPHRQLETIFKIGQTFCRGGARWRTWDMPPIPVVNIASPWENFPLSSESLSRQIKYVIPNGDRSLQRFTSVCS